MKPKYPTETIQAVLSSTEFSDYSIIPIDEGVSTDVYKLVGDVTVYLRILPEDEPAENQTFVHKLLQEHGVSVPEVLYTKEKLPEIEHRSIMITSEIPGESVKDSKKSLESEILDRVLHEAGRQIAIVNSIPVKKVGWIHAVQQGILIADASDYEGYLLYGFKEKLETITKADVLDSKTTNKLQEHIKERLHYFQLEQTSHLAHGDFCIDHIFQKDGVYTGLIDFGDLQGTTLYHDLAHFYLFDRKFIDPILQGYQEIHPLDENFHNRIITEAFLIAINKLHWKISNNKLTTKLHLYLSLFEEIIKP